MGLRRFLRDYCDFDGFVLIARGSLLFLPCINMSTFAALIYLTLFFFEGWLEGMM